MGRGWRSSHLLEFLNETGLTVTNDPEELQYEDAWSFTSCLGNKRVLDYVLSTGVLEHKHVESNDRAGFRL